MKRGVKIGLGILIILICILAIPIPDTTKEKINETASDDTPDTLPYSPNVIYGRAGKEVTVGNWKVSVSPPTYRETFYEKDYFGSYQSEDTYRVYKDRDKYHFALVKIKVTNYGKEENDPFFYNEKLVTTKEFRYKEKSTAYETKYITSIPSPIFKGFEPLDNVLPRETSEGYLYFEIPEKAVPEYLTFKYYDEPDVKIKIKL